MSVSWSQLIFGVHILENMGVDTNIISLSIIEAKLWSKYVAVANFYFLLSAADRVYIIFSSGNFEIDITQVLYLI